MSYEKALFLINEVKKSHSKTLNLTGFELTELPPELFTLTWLEELFLSLNELTTVPAEIKNLKNLTSLTLNKNSLQQIPAEIGQLSNLTTLDLSDNKLTWLPEEIGSLTKLYSLNLSHNRLSVLPSEIDRMINIKNIFPIEHAPGKVSDNDNQLTILENIYSQETISIEPEQNIDQLGTTGWLDLANNNTSELPNTIGHLPHLKSMLEKNQLNKPVEDNDYKEPEAFTDTFNEN